ncbi:MAG: arsenic resistance N-acetyltransferase ArsN2 [Gammaproteobacteria bacterium]|nr:arsenic resistance N-acetyltransferase ArsN2 [Gammaproteobacteria bacterium]
MIQDPPRIEPATGADWPEVVALLAGIGLPFDDLGSGRPLEFLLARDDDGRIVGTIGLEGTGRERLIRSLAVAPALRGHGLGSALLAAAEAQARREGVQRLYLLTLTPAFFDHRGYHAVARDAVPPAVAASAEFSRLCPGDAACLIRELDAAPGAERP